MLSSVIARATKRNQSQQSSISTLRIIASRSVGLQKMRRLRTWNTTTTTSLSSSAFSSSSSWSINTNERATSAAAAPFNVVLRDSNETTRTTAAAALSSRQERQVLSNTTITTSSYTATTRQGCYKFTNNHDEKMSIITQQMMNNPIVVNSSMVPSSVMYYYSRRGLSSPAAPWGQSVVSSLVLNSSSQQQQQLHQQQCRFATSSSSSSSSSSISAPPSETTTAKTTTSTTAVPVSANKATPSSPSSSSKRTSTSTSTISRSTIPTPSSAPPINSLKDTLVPKPMAILKQISDWTIYLGRTILLGLFVRLPRATWHYMQHPAEFKARYQHLKQVAKDEMHHYWVGTKLLVADVRTARDLTRKTLHGNALTRRERSQLLRTVADLFRLIPFSMFLIIPLAEFALPFALKVFPNLLPSTFQDSLKAEENMKRELQSRLAMAQFFQETLEELAKEQKRKARKARKDSSSSSLTGAGGVTTATATTDGSSNEAEDSAASMLEFLQKARNGEMLESSVIIRYAKYFQDDLTLDNMPRMQLMNMSKYMNIAPYGSDSFLRFQLRHRIRILKEDDQRILWEGIESLTKMELREACQERGMRSTGMSKDAYKYALQQWLDLSVQKNVPISLLIMSRSFFLREDIFNPPDSSTVSTAAASTAAATTTVAASFPTTMAAAAERVSMTTTDSFTTTASSAADPDKLTSTTTFTDASTSQPTTKLDLGHRGVAGIADAISGLDKDIVSSVILEVATEKEKLTDPEIRKLKLQVLSQQNELIKQEKADQEQANLAKKKEKEQQVATAAAAAATAGAEYTLEQQQQQQSVLSTTKASILNAAEVKDSSPSFTTTTTTPIIPAEVVETEPEEEEQSMDLSTNEMDALRQLVTDDPVSAERAQFQQIKAAMTKRDHKEDEEEEEPIMVMGSVDAQEMTASTMGQEERVATGFETSTPKSAMTPEETDRMVAETIERLDTAAATSDSTTITTTTTTTETESQSPSIKTTPVVEDDDTYLEEEMIADDPIVARLKKRIESMLDKIEVQLSDVHLKIGDKLHMLDKDKDGILTQKEVADVLQLVLKREITSEEAKEIAGEMDEDHDGVLTVEELMRWIDENKLVKFVEEGRDADMDRVMEEVQTPTNPAEKDANDSNNSIGKIKDNNIP